MTLTPFSYRLNTRAAWRRTTNSVPDKCERFFCDGLRHSVASVAHDKACDRGFSSSLSRHHTCSLCALYSLLSSEVVGPVKEVN